GVADLSRGAIAALKCIVIDGGLLQRMQLTVACKALDGGYFGAFLHYRQRQAGIDPPPVDQNGARAALSVVAALLGAGQVEMVAQCVQQRGPWGDREFHLAAVDGQPDRNFLRHRGSPRYALRCARSSHVDLRLPGLVREMLGAE